MNNGENIASNNTSTNNSIGANHQRHLNINYSNLYSQHVHHFQQNLDNSNHLHLNNGNRQTKRKKTSIF